MKLHVTIDSRIRFLLADARKVFGDAGVRELLKQFTHKNPTFYKARAQGFWSKESPKIETYGSSDDGQMITLPRGGMSRLRACARDKGVGLVFKDNRVAGELLGGEQIPNHQAYDSQGRACSLWDHQQRAMEAVLIKQNCLIRAATASGKTTTALALIARLKVPSLVIVWTQSLLKQWTERCAKELGLQPREIGIIRGGSRRLKPVTIAMQQTLARGITREELNTFGLVIMDEAQRAPATTFFKAIDPFPARYRIGISADETRADHKEFLTYDLFGEIADEVSRKELETLGVVVKIEIILIPSKFTAPWWTRVQQFDDADLRSEQKSNHQLNEEIATNEQRNKLILDVAREEASKNQQLLIFTLLREHARKLDQQVSSYDIKSGLLLGGDEYAAEFDTTAAAVKAGTCRVASGTIQAIGTGNDFPRVSAGILAHPIRNNRQLFMQVRGRIARAFDGKQSGRLYVIYDEEVFGVSMIRNFIRWNGGNVFVKTNTGLQDGAEYLRHHKRRR